MRLFAGANITPAPKIVAITLRVMRFRYADRNGYNEKGREPNADGQARG